MKRILKLLARFYPSAWHDRYGAEFDALLEDRQASVRDVFDVLWGAMKMQMTTGSFWRIALACSFAGLLAAVAISFAMPVRYESQTVFTIAPARGGPALSAGGDREQIIASLGNAFSRDFLASLIQTMSLYPRERARMPLSDVVSRMQRDIHARPASNASSGDRGSFSFVVGFDYPEPRVAQQVEGELVARLVTENVRISAEAAKAGHPLRPKTVRVENAPSLPLAPVGLSRTKLGSIGLFAGLLADLGITITGRLRRAQTVAKS
jgi:hypothetical protein